MQPIDTTTSSKPTAPAKLRIRNLATRGVFQATALTCIARQRQQQLVGNAANVAVIVFDVDRYSTINYALGHQFAFQVLEEVAQRLMSGFERAASIAHLGNDQFAVLLCGHSAAQVRIQAHQALRKIRRVIRIKEHEMLLTASAGFSVFPERADNADQLIDQAAVATNHAKQNGGDGVRYFDAAEQKQPLKRLNLELELRRAIAEKELSVHYQPKFDLHRGRVDAVEALARWHHPQRGWVAADEFISVAEEAGLVAAIGEFVLLEACTEGAKWLTDPRMQGIEKIAVNVSAPQLLNKNLVSGVERALAKAGFPAQRLTLEITESLFLDAQPQIMERLQQLRNMGIAIAIDDFGTGYSSLSLLKRCPANILKIDQQFVRDVETNEVDATITRAVIDIAHSLKLQVIAEGVENSAHIEFLKDSGCDAIQGFYIGRPVPADEVHSLLTPV